MDANRYTANAGDTVQLDLSLTSAGVLVDAPTAPTARVLAADGTVLADTFTVVHPKTGTYRISWSAPADLATGIYYDEWVVTPATDAAALTIRFPIYVGVPNVRLRQDQEVPPALTGRFSAQAGTTAKLCMYFFDRSGYPVDPAVLNDTTVVLQGHTTTHTPVRDYKGVYHILYPVASTAQEGQGTDTWSYRYASADAEVTTMANVFKVRNTGYYATVSPLNVDLTFYPDVEILTASSRTYLRIPVREREGRIDFLPEAALSLVRLEPDGSRTTIVSGAPMEPIGMSLYYLTDTEGWPRGMYEYQVTLTWGQERILSPLFHFRLV